MTPDDRVGDAAWVVLLALLELRVTLLDDAEAPVMPVWGAAFLEGLRQLPTAVDGPPCEGA